MEDSPVVRGLSFRMGVDGISVLFVLLTAFLMPICIAASWKAIDKRVHEYMVAFLVLETLVIGVFCALDLVLFYVFFEVRPGPDVPDHRHLGAREAGSTRPSSSSSTRCWARS